MIHTKHELITQEPDGTQIRYTWSKTLGIIHNVKKFIAGCRSGEWVEATYYGMNLPTVKAPKPQPKPTHETDFNGSYFRGDVPGCTCPYCKSKRGE